MSSRTHQFNRIRARRWQLDSDLSYVEYLRGVGSRRIRLFGSITYEDQQVADLPDSLLRVPHSTEQPAIEDTYWLFGFRLDQAIWFDLLDYSPEDRLAHLLQWGQP